MGNVDFVRKAVLTYRRAGKTRHALVEIGWRDTEQDVKVTFSELWPQCKIVTVNLNPEVRTA